MHACLNVDEIVRLLACELVTSGKGTAAALACCRKSFEDPVLDAVWEVQDQLRPLLKSFPGDVLDDEGGKWVSALVAFDSLSTKLFGWVVFQEDPHQRGMGPLPEVRSKDPSAQSESVSIPPSPRCSLGPARPRPQHTPTSWSEDLPVQRSDCGVYPVSHFVPLPEDHEYRHQLCQIPPRPSYLSDRCDDRHLYDKMPRPAKDRPMAPTQEPHRC